MSSQHCGTTLNVPEVEGADQIPNLTQSSLGYLKLLLVNLSIYPDMQDPNSLNHPGGQRVANTVALHSASSRGEDAA